MEKTGIRYSDARTHFNFEKIEWNEIGKRAILEIVVKPGSRRSTSISGRLKLQTNNGQPLPIDVFFDINQVKERIGLMNVLKLLRGKNIQVITSVEDTTSGDKSRSKILDEIKMLTEGK